MKTACQENPEMWVSDFPSERSEAAKECKACPAIEWCADWAAKIEPTWGVFAGVDHSRTKLKPRQPAASVCQNPECGAGLMYDGTRRRFCRDTCQQRAAYLKKRAS